MPAAAQLPKVSAEDAVQAARDCASAATKDGVEADILAQRGWAPGTIESKGKSAATPLRIFGKDSGSPVIMTSASAGAAGKSCLITGGMAKNVSFNDIKEAFAAAFAIAGDKDGSTYFRIGPDIAILSPTGSRRSPSFRVAVMELGETN